MKVGEAREIVGGLSNPDKMPKGCRCWSISARHCQTGRKLAVNPNSACALCYAYFRGRYRFDNVQNALDRRLAAYNADPDRWAAAMVVAINGAQFFRWFDSGDLQPGMLERIARIAEQTPDTRHWLPTQERQYVKQYLREHGAFPENLVVRVSAPIVDGPAGNYPNNSRVFRDNPAGHVCPAPKQGNKCGDCRACWDPEVKTVSYKAH